jgi:hypothetical protein
MNTVKGRLGMIERSVLNFLTSVHLFLTQRVLLTVVFRARGITSMCAISRQQLSTGSNFFSTPCI